MCPTEYSLTIQPWRTDGCEGNGRRLICQVHGPQIHNTKVEIMNRCSTNSTCEVRSRTQMSHGFIKVMADTCWNDNGNYFCYIKHSRPQKDKICGSDDFPSIASCSHGEESCTQCGQLCSKAGSVCEVGLR